MKVKNDDISFMVTKSEDDKAYKLIVYCETEMTYEDFLDCVQYFLIESVEELKQVLAEADPSVKH